MPSSDEQAASALLGKYGFCIEDDNTIKPGAEPYYTHAAQEAIFLLCNEYGYLLTTLTEDAVE